MQIYKRAKILATVGPATNSYEQIEKLVLAGVNGFRLNFSHGTQEERTEQIGWIRKASDKIGKPVAILQDLQGPKIRLGDFEGEISMKKGEQWTLVYGKESDAAKKVLTVQYDLSKKVKAKERLYLFDGKVRTTITKVKRKEVQIRVENDGVVMKRKGINLPDTDFKGDILTDKDKADIAFGAKADIDYVALSFVQSANDIARLRKLLSDHDSSADVVAKIETKAAIDEDELEKIVWASDAVMVARGDLAVEVSPEVVPIVQRRILGLCQKYARISIVATQMMASMVESPEPTRAEVSDVANAVITGADCLMLSDETANGKYPIETVAVMKRVILYTQEQVPVRPIFVRDGAHESQQDAISSAAVSLASQIEARAIVAETKSGATARSIAAHRPGMPLVSVTSEPKVAQKLALLYANKSFMRPDGEKAGLELSKELRTTGFFDPRSTVVLVSGRQPGLIGGTDTIRVRHLE